ncbi:diacylglycerol/lipid kinase family protein [Nitrosococcus wardiae]|uniref:Diacylglycerol kinase family lipid kinase n=1 Tax=Nitrosococcus wardiae TaxID=1814290 RepID=A0A4P7C286_9GAMM|nr:diacylglycerol kinase family protein [Nitrosococcus wardiae]QBQ55760.1 diacylglycerol kinase family lipid kinase [Nitrosococcus wardiae]
MKFLQNGDVNLTTKTKTYALDSAGSRLFLILNPVAGSCKAEQVRNLLKQYCEMHGIGYDIYETTGKEHLPSIVRQAQEQDYSVIAAAGGDGTVSAVASGLLHSQIPLAIIPVGTANLLARELAIPLEVEAACQLVVKGGRIRKIDAMQVGDQILISHISIGSYSRIAERTTVAAKRYFRQLAYVWSALAELIGTRVWRFNLRIDDREQRIRAAFIMIANVGEMGAASLRWGAEVEPDDGQIDVCIVRARTLLHYLSFMWHILWRQHKQSPHTIYLRAEKNIKVSTKWNLPVRGDGEIIGRANVDIQIIPKAIPIIAPVVVPDKMAS